MHLAIEVSYAGFGKFFVAMIMFWWMDVENKFIVIPIFDNDFHAKWLMYITDFVKLNLYCIEK